MAENNTIETKVVLDSTQAQQSIAKLNGIASDSTRELDERLEAKNKQVEIQNQLSEQTISLLEEEIKSLEELGGKEKEIEKLKAKINRETVKNTKQNVAAEKAQRKLSKSLEDSKDSFKNLDEATGGLIGKFKLFLSNPIGITITALVGIFKTFQEVISRNSEASEKFNKITGKLSAVFNALLKTLEPLVNFLLDKVLEAFNDPQKAIEDLATAIKDNLTERLNSLIDTFGLLASAAKKLLSGDLKGALDDVKGAGKELIDVTTGVDGSVDKLNETSKEFIKTVKEQEKVSALLANKERELVRNRIELEKQQLRSQDLAEKERQIRDDISKTIPERIEANQRLGKILDEQSQRELKLARQNLELANAEILATGQTIENIEAKGDAEIKLIEIQERISGQRSEQLVNEQALLKEQRDKDLEAIEFEIAKDEAELERKRLKNEVTLQDELDFLEKQRLQKLEKERITQEEIDLINAEFALAREEKEIENAEKIREEEELAKQKILDAREEELSALGDNESAKLALKLEFLRADNEQTLRNTQLTGEAKKKLEDKFAKEELKLLKTLSKNKVSEAADAAGAAFGIEKEVALAKTLLSAPEAIAGVFKEGAKLPFPANVAHIATGLATNVPPIISSINAIKGSKTPKGASSSSSSGGATPTVPSAPTATGPDLSSILNQQAIISDISNNNLARRGVDSSITSNATRDASSNVSGSSSGNVIFSEDSYQEFVSEVSFKEDKSTI